MRVKRRVFAADLGPQLIQINKSPRAVLTAHAFDRRVSELGGLRLALRHAAGLGSEREGAIDSGAKRLE
jgi:hypothetical protein